MGRRRPCPSAAAGHRGGGTRASCRSRRPPPDPGRRRVPDHGCWPRSGMESTAIEWSTAGRGAPGTCVRWRRGTERPARGESLRQGARPTPPAGGRRWSPRAPNPHGSGRARRSPGAAGPGAPRPRLPTCPRSPLPAASAHLRSAGATTPCAGRGPSPGDRAPPAGRTRVPRAGSRSRSLPIVGSRRGRFRGRAPRGRKSHGGSVLPGHSVMPIRPWPSRGVTAAMRIGLSSLVLGVGILFLLDPAEVVDAGSETMRSPDSGCCRYRHAELLECCPGIRFESGERDQSSQR